MMAAPSTLCASGANAFTSGHLSRVDAGGAQTHRLFEPGDAQHPLDQAAAEITVVIARTFEEPIDIDTLSQYDGARDQFEDLVPVLAQESAVYPSEPLLVASPLRRQRDER